jgi:E3 ubiquitin-protein ligase RGLG
MLELVVVAVVIWFVYLAFMAVLGKGGSGTSSGGGSSSGAGSSAGFTTIADKYETIEEVQEHLRRAGLESSNLILGIDYTKSNEYNGRYPIPSSLHPTSQSIFFRPLF